MHEPTEVTHIFRFGDFGLDVRAHELRQAGVRRRLQEQPFQILKCLVERAGQVVTREELRQRVWPSSVYVDFDHGLNNALSALRDTLGDSAANPHYIETLPRLGYRFICPVASEPLPTTDAITEAGTFPDARSASSSPSTDEALQRNRRRLAFAIGTIVIFVLAGLLAGVWLTRRSADESRVASVSEVPSIAVLPFADMSVTKNQEYMADGMAEELLNLLSQVQDLKVIARTSSFAFKGQNIELAEIAKRLNVAYVLEGSVRTSGEQLRITAQLVRASDSTHLWSNTYDRPLDDIFAVQDEIAKAVVSELKIKLLGAAPKAKEKEPEAYALVLKARDIGEQHTPLAYEQSISLYRQALELDPGYAEAWDGLANNYAYQGIDGIRRSDEAFRLASEAAHKALALDPQYAQAHARLGWIAINYDLDLRSAARHLSHALALDPSNTDIIEWAGLLLRRLGRLDQAIEIGKYLAVHDPLNADAHLELGLTHKYAGHWDAAITQYRSALALSPSAMGGHGVIGEVLVLQGNAEAALAEVRLETDAAWRLHVKSLAHHALGQSAASEAALAEMIKSHGDKNASYIADEAAFRGDTDRAFEWLEKAAQQRDPSLGSIAFSQFCENLHEDPRWLPYLRKHGMAPEQLAAIKFDVKLPE